jgi:hypothetical protein
MAGVYDPWGERTSRRRTEPRHLDLQLALLGLRHNDPSLLVAHGGGAARDPRLVQLAAR